mmetsp:Transcript_36018/g.41751  ORF Transcript_36018/g.41751 Transcript_36018/m.41751 type:complete len:108 (-) Transcript_36018:1410-1733(-)
MPDLMQSFQHVRTRIDVFLGCYICYLSSFLGGSLEIFPIATVFPSLLNVNRPKKGPSSKVSTGTVRATSIMHLTRIPSFAYCAFLFTCPLAFVVSKILVMVHSSSQQ